MIFVRPTPSPQAALLEGSGELRLVELSTGRAVGSLNVGPIDFDHPGRWVVSIDDAGTRVAVLHRTEAVARVWDIGSGRPTGPAAPVGPLTSGLLGFAPDGYLVAGVYGYSRLDFLDPTTGRQSGSLSISGLSMESVMDGESLRVVGIGGRMPQQVPVTAAGWFAMLCAVADRPFTPAELAILPTGVDTDPPCRP
jgi:hypothetical protein